MHSYSRSTTFTLCSSFRLLVLNSSWKCFLHTQGTGLSETAVTISKEYAAMHLQILPLKKIVNSVWYVRTCMVRMVLWYYPLCPSPTFLSLQIYVDTCWSLFFNMFENWRRLDKVNPLEGSRFDDIAYIHIYTKNELYDKHFRVFFHQVQDHGGE